jgi:Ni/Co efflux regulator RcnB
VKIRKLLTGSTLLVFAFATGALQARSLGQNQDNRSQDQRDRDNRNQGNHNQYGQDDHNQNGNGQHGQNHDRFDDHDRQVSRDWYNQHRDNRPRGLRDRDRLPDRYEARLHEGYVLDPYMRSRVYAVPSDYYRNLPPAPRGYRYVFVGGHAVLIDSGYRVHDVIHFELNF